MTDPRRDSFNPTSSSRPSPGSESPVESSPASNGNAARKDRDSDSEIFDEDDDNDDAGEEEYYSDGEAMRDDMSMIGDLLRRAEDRDIDEPMPLGEDPEHFCTPEESRYYRARLRKVGISQFVEETITARTVSARKLCTAFGIYAPFWYSRPDSAWYLILGKALQRELAKRIRLTQYSTIDDVVGLLQRCSKILVVTGAGISTNLGIPDFRSKDTGFYAKMADRFDDPQAIFDIELFDDDPSIFFSCSAETLPAPGKTSPTHAFIKLLETQGKLLTNYTQNIDNIEGNMGISRDKVIQCHGSWATFTCRKCHFRDDGIHFYDEVKEGRVPRCPRCPESLALQHPTLKRKRSTGNKPKKRTSNGLRQWNEDDDDDDDEDSAAYDIPEAGVMKPDITFFGEQLPETFFDRFNKHDRQRVDLVIVIGTSLMVGPVNEIPLAVEANVPCIYISRDPVKHINFDVVLLGDCDTICEELARRAKWDFKHPMLKHQEVVVEKDDEKGWVWSVTKKTQKLLSIPTIEAFRGIGPTKTA